MSHRLHSKGALFAQTGPILIAKGRVKTYMLMVSDLKDTAPPCFIDAPMTGFFMLALVARRSCAVLPPEGLKLPFTQVPDALQTTVKPRAGAAGA